MTISAEKVVKACAEYAEQIQGFKDGSRGWDGKGNSLTRLMLDTEEVEEDCRSAMADSAERGLLKFPLKLIEVAHPTEKGLELLAKGKKNAD